MRIQEKVLGNVFAQIISKSISSIISFFIAVIIARVYGADGYGDFTKIVSYVVVFYLFADFGMNAVFLRYSEAERKKIHISSLLVIRLLISTVLIFIALSILSFLPYNQETGDGFSPWVKIGIILLSPTIITMALQTSFNALFQKHLRYDKAMIASVLGSITTISMIILLSRLSAPVSMLVIGYLAGGVVTVISAYFISHSLTQWRLVNWKKQGKIGKSIFLASLPLGLTLIFSVINFRADVFILTIYRSTQEVGIYGLASKFFEFALTIPTYFMNVVYPILLASVSNEEKTRKIVIKSGIALSAVSLVILVSGVLSAPLLVYINEEFIASILPFRIFMIMLPLFFISSVLMWYLIAKDKTWQLVWVYLIGTLINIGLNMIFIPQFGAIAAAVTTGISEAVIVFLLFYYAYPLLLRLKS